MGGHTVRAARLSKEERGEGKPTCSRPATGGATSSCGRSRPAHAGARHKSQTRTLGLALPLAAQGQLCACPVHRAARQYADAVQGVRVPHKAPCDHMRVPGPTSKTAFQAASASHRNTAEQMPPITP